ncbi:MAG: 50S ribosomal protein L9 [Eubacteriales bacterium]|nr:50S ribosomal protein L9 [Eubacteriales bacterium]
MKVILLEDVKALGKKGELVEVNAGYARNFILPKKLGVEATGKNINDLKLQKAHQDKVAAEQLAEAKALAEELKEKSVQVEMKVGEGGKTFGTISTKEIAAAAKEQLNLELDKKKISVDEPIKSLGVHNVKIKLHPKVSATLAVKVAEKK